MENEVKMNVLGNNFLLVRTGINDSFINKYPMFQVPPPYGFPFCGFTTTVLGCE